MSVHGSRSSVSSADGRFSFCSRDSRRGEVRRSLLHDQTSAAREFAFQFNITYGWQGARHSKSALRVCLAEVGNSIKEKV